MTKYILTIMLILGLAFPLYLKAQDLETLAADFYNGLADIIENNMDNPNACVAAIEEFYAANQELIVQMREAAQKSIGYGENQMSQEQIQTMMLQQSITQQMPDTPVTRAAMRYSNALTLFSQRYPQQAATIAAQAMVLMPEEMQMGF